MIPLKINNRQYYFKNISDNDYSYSRSLFYKEVIKERLVNKRKYFFFGKVISEKIVKKTTIEYCFDFLPIDLYNFTSHDNLINELKIVEESYIRKSNLLEGNISI